MPPTPLAIGISMVLCLHTPAQEGTRAAKYGLGQDQFGLKFRFFDNEKTGFAIATFPQLSVNNPNRSVQRGITPPRASLIIPLEFTKRLQTINVNWEVGYNLVHLGTDGWIAGIVVGHDVSKQFQVDAELYGLGTISLSNNQQTLGVGAWYRLHPSFTLLLMAGRSVTAAHKRTAVLCWLFRHSIPAAAEAVLIQPDNNDMLEGRGAFARLVPDKT